MLMELGLAERRTDEGAAVNHLRAALDLLVDPARRGATAHELGRALWFNDRIPEALNVFEQALDEVDREREPDLYELLLAELIGSAWWEPDTYPLAEQQIATLDLDTLEGGFGSEVLLATMSHYEYRLGADRERAVDLARRALASGRLLASGTVAFTYASQALDIAGLFREARSLYDEAVARARRRGDIVQVALFLMWRGKCATHAGDLPAAIGDLREAIDLGVQHGLRVSSPYNVGFFAEALLEQGNAGDAERVLAESGFPEGLPPNLHLIPVRLIRGRLRAEGSDPARGLDELLELGDLVRRVPFDNPGWLPWRCAAAEALRRLDRADEAVALVEEELVLARRWGAPHAIGAALRMLGLLKDGTEGEPQLRQAVSVLAGSEARLEHARSLVELGAALRRRNQRSDARALLREGAELAQALGATGLAERADEEIAATGARPRKPLQTGIDALTASERRVAQLATEGMSNKEIAQALFVTVKTVEVHLSSVYRKLHISSRAQLGKALMTSPSADAELTRA
jgi:DNA-binding NarL/FixJ family response regulator